MASSQLSKMTMKYLYVWLFFLYICARVSVRRFHVKFCELTSIIKTNYYYKVILESKRWSTRSSSFRDRGSTAPGRRSLIRATSWTTSAKGVIRSTRGRATTRSFVCSGAIPLSSCKELIARMRRFHKQPVFLVRAFCIGT